jgi:thioredoxin reductase (NADPH)
VIHRRDALRASKIMQERALRNEKIEFAWNSEVAEVLGDECVKGVRNPQRRRRRRARRCRSRRYSSRSATSRTPTLFRGQIDLDPTGYIQVTRGRVPPSRACSRAATRWIRRTVRP